MTIFRNVQAWKTLAAVTTVLAAGTNLQAQEVKVPNQFGSPPTPMPATPIIAQTSEPVALPAVIPQPTPADAPASPGAHGGMPHDVVVDLTPAHIPEGHAGHAGHGNDCGCYESKLHHHLEDTHGRWFATGEYLLWRSRMDGLGYAIVDPVDDFTPTGRVANVNQEVASGLRVALGYRLPGQGWDIGITYTYLDSTGEEAVAAPPGGLVYPTYTRPGVIDAVGRAIGFASFDYNVFDIDVGRTWHVDEHLNLRTYGGVRIAAIDLDYGARYDGGQAIQAMATNRLAFDGAGPTAGVGANWNIGRGVGLIGNTRTGLLYGDFTSRVVETNGVAPLPAVLTDISDEFSGVAPFLSVALGGSYTWRNLSFAAGYEVTHYFNLGSQPVLVDDFAEGKYLRKRNDFSFDGVFFRLGMTY